MSVLIRFLHSAFQLFTEAWVLLHKGFKALRVVRFVVQGFKPRLLHTGIAEILVCAFYRVPVRFPCRALLWGFLRGFLRGFCSSFTLYLCGLLSLLRGFLLGLCGGFGFLPCGGFLCSLFFVKQLDVCLLVRFFFRAFTAIIQVSDALKFLLYGKVAVFNRFDGFLCGACSLLRGFLLRRSHIKLVKHFFLLCLLFCALLRGGVLCFLRFGLHIFYQRQSALNGALSAVLRVIVFNHSRNFRIRNNIIKLCIDSRSNGRVFFSFKSNFHIFKNFFFCVLKFFVYFCIAGKSLCHKLI